VFAETKFNIGEPDGVVNLLLKSGRWETVQWNELTGFDVRGMEALNIRMNRQPWRIVSCSVL